MNTLITGGSGLLGSFIDFGLKPNRKELDVLDYNQFSNYVKTHNVSSIIHSAGLVGGVKANTDFVYDFFAENIQMNMNAMNVCKQYGLQRSTFIISTCAFPKNAPLPLEEKSLHEGEPHETNFGYAYAKRMLEVGSRALKQQYNISSCCLIPCNLYGDNDNYNIQNGHVIPSLIHKCYLAKKNNTTFEIWGSGKAEREFMYAEDLANIIGMIHQSNMDIQGAMVVSPNNVVSIEEIVHTIVRKMNFTGKVFFDKTKPEGILRKNTSNNIFRKHFPDYKFIDLEQGLTKTIEYFVRNYDSVRK